MKTTFSRTFFPAAITLLTALLLVGISIQVLVKDYLEKQSLERLKGNATTISELATAYYADDSLSRQEFLIHLSVASQVSGADAVICDRSGRLILCADAPLGCSHQGMYVSDTYLEDVLNSGFTTYTGPIVGLYPEARYVVAVPIFEQVKSTPIGIVIVSAPTQDMLEVLERISDVYLWVSVLVMLTATLIMSLLTRRVTSPLREIARTAHAFGHGKLDSRVTVNPSSPEEVQQLSLAFNNMASSLQKSEYQRQEFVANVSHELKTPMTTISGYVDGMLDGTIPPEKQPQYLQIVSQETKRLSRLVRSMLEISRLQNQDGIPEEKKTRFEITEAVGQVLITFEQKITGKNLDVQVDMPEHPVFTQADPDAITQVIYHLVDNAVKFCPEAGILGVQIREGSAKVYITISNSGQTIPPEELPLIFDRFHKLDKSRSQNRDGWGLGLYIVKTLVCSHGEDISVSSKNGKTAFTFTLPLVN